MWMTKFIVILVLVHATQSDLILQQFTRDYYVATSAHQIIVFACWDDTGKLE